MRLLDGQSCAVRARELLAQATPIPSPSASPTPAGPPAGVPGGGPLYATPFPSSTPATPLPVPTPTPVPSGSPGPVYLVRPSGAPSIAPKEQVTPPGSPEPSAAPTLRPGYVAVLADKVTGSTKPGVPGDATGNVHIFYQDEVLVGERAHYDGIRTITVSGNPYVINNAKNSILYADKIVFDTVAQTAKLYKGRGESSQGVQQGLVYFGARSMKSDQHGVSHGEYATVSTCERPRAGYHITGRTIDVYPGDKIVITRAILWLGAAAVFFLPKVVIPLRTVSDQRRKPQFFPEVGYNSYQGYYVQAHLSFGYTQYYYGYYTIDFYTKQGTTLGYDGTINKKNGRRSTTIDVTRTQNRLQHANQYNVKLADTENYSQTLHAQTSYTYQSAFGPYTNLPPQRSLSAQVMHNHGNESQNYTFSNSSNGTLSSSSNYGFTDTRNFAPTLSNNFSATLGHTQNNYGVFISSATGHVTDLVHWSTKALDYQLNFDKTYSNTPSGINKEPELIVRPMLFIPHFVFPIAPQLTLGQYNEAQTPFTTGRADLGLNMGPLLYKFGNNSFSANVNVNQYAYGTGDLKASVQQTMSLTSQWGNHVNNVLSYNENNYNGPGSVPFATLDLQNSPNTKNANDTVRFFNGDVYNLSLSFNTSFNMMAQPVQYVLTMRPTAKSYVNLQGSFNPGSHNGFYQTAAQLAFPLGTGSLLQFQGNVDWKNKGRIINKTIYFSRIIGDCYQIQISYNQDSKQLIAGINVLAFPTQGVTFGLTNKGSIVPSGFNGAGY